MNSRETNAALRQMVLSLIDQGWSKTRIARALLGDNGQGHVNHWLDSDSGHINDFGVKPLTTIADQIKHEIHLVFVPKENTEEVMKFKNQLNSYNAKFISTLSETLVQFLTAKLDEKPKITQRKVKTKIDKVLNDLLGIEPLITSDEVIDQEDLAPEER